jgi:hypothetical protein
VIKVDTTILVRTTLTIPIFVVRNLQNQQRITGLVPMFDTNSAVEQYVWNSWILIALQELYISVLFRFDAS